MNKYQKISYIMCSLMVMSGIMTIILLCIEKEKLGLSFFVLMLIIGLFTFIYNLRLEIKANEQYILELYGSD